MATSIPYDPSLTLGNIVAPAKLEVLMDIASLESQISAKQAEVNNYIRQQTDLRRVKAEVAKIGVDTSKIEKGIKDLDNSIAQAGEELGEVIVANAPKIAKQQATILGIGDSVESPIDFTKSTLKTLPLGAPSMTMDSQYFHKEENSQDSTDHMSAIAAMVQGGTSGLGVSASAAAAKSAAKQASQQYQHHDIMGTLVITCHCTHSRAQLFAPLTLDVDKAVKVWNAAIKDGQLKATPLDPTDPSTMEKVLSEQGTGQDVALNLLSGVTYGSSFVAMVHLVNNTSSSTSQSDTSKDTSVGTAATDDNVNSQSQKTGLIQSAINKIRGKMAMASAQGQFGLSHSDATQMANLFSDQEVSVHINIICMGLIPTIAVESFNSSVEKFSNFDPQSMMDTLNTINSNTASTQSTVSSDATKSQTGAQLLSAQSANTKTVMQAAGDFQTENNQYFNLTTLMTAFSDYIKNANSGNIGIPINYYLAPITAYEISRLWLLKYLPDNQFLGINPITDDSSNDSGSSSSSSSS